MPSFKPQNSYALCVILLLILTAGLSAQQRGNSFLRFYSAQEYQSHSQSWSVSQLPEGFIVASTGVGLVVFDGEKVGPVQGARAMINFTLVGSDGHLYTGFTNLIGRLERDEFGNFTHRRLIPAEKLDSIGLNAPTGMREYQDGVMFTTRQHLLHYAFDSGEIRRIDSPSGDLFGLFEIEETLFVASSEFGLLYLDNNLELVPAPGGEDYLPPVSPHFMIPFDENRMLIGTVREGLYLYTFRGPGAGSSQRFLTGTSYLNGDVPLSSAATRLHDGTFAIATSTNGVFIIDTSGNLLQVIDITSGLPTELVQDIYQDRQGNLWIATNNGVAMAETSTPVTYFNSKNGLDGAVIALESLDATIVAATSTGLFHLVDRTFFAYPEITSATWDLAAFKDPFNPDEKQLLAANTFGLYLVNSSGSTMIRDGMTVSVYQSEVNPHRIYFGTANTLHYLIRTQDGFQESPHYNQIENPVRQILEDEAGWLWVATQSGGVYQFKDGTKLDEYTHFNQTEDFNLQQNATLQLLNGELFVSTVTNFYRYDRDRDTFDPWRHPDLPDEAFLDIYRFRLIDESLWVGASNSRDRVTRIDGFLGSDPVEKTAGLHNISTLVNLAIYPAFDAVWIGNADGLYRYEAASVSRYIPFSNLDVRSVTQIADTTRRLSLVSENRNSLPFSQSRFRFEVSAPWFNAEPFMEYRYMLEGFDLQWSDWQSENVVEYTALREGVYRFMVQARNRDGSVAENNAFYFQILPPWYRTLWAYFGYGLGLIGLMLVGSRTFSRYQNQRLEEFNRKLEDQVRERAEEIRRQNDKLRQLNKEKDDFMNIAAHDLRNPLSGIQGIGSILLDLDENPPLHELHDFGDIIVDSSDRMFALIDNYLNVHRIEQGQVRADLVSVDCESIIQESLGRYQLQAGNKRMDLEYDASGAGVVVHADPRLTAQILDNLISNAIKYSPPGSTVKVSVQELPANQGEASDLSETKSLRGGVKGNAVAITVQDEGPGIPKEKQSELYQKFSRIGSVPTGGEVSVGLGLSIVKQLALMMNGDVTCDSEPGKGSAFSVILPAGKS